MCSCLLIFSKIYCTRTDRTYKYYFHSPRRDVHVLLGTSARPMRSPFRSSPDRCTSARASRSMPRCRCTRSWTRWTTSAIRWSISKSFTNSICSFPRCGHADVHDFLSCFLGSLDGAQVSACCNPNALAPPMWSLSRCCGPCFACSTACGTRRSASSSGRITVTCCSVCGRRAPSIRSPSPMPRALSNSRRRSRRRATPTRAQFVFQYRCVFSCFYLWGFDFLIRLFVSASFA